MRKIRKGISFFLALLLVIGLIPFAAFEAEAATAANLTISPNGIDFIKSQEGFSERCYSDTSQSSIGYGTRCGTEVHESGLHSITKSAAEAAMKNMLENSFVPTVRRQMAHLELNQSQFDALVSLAYNTGGGSSIIKDAPLVKHLMGELSEAEARKQYSNYYVYSGGQLLAGLIERRKAEADLFFSETLVKETYPCYGKLTVTVNGTNVQTLPCSKEASKDSTIIETAAKGTTYTAICLVRNNASKPGELWYKVTAKNGKTGFIYAGNTGFAQLTDDLSVSSVVAPSQVQLGSSFSIKGNINAKHQSLCNVGVQVKTPKGEYVTGGTEDIDAMSYSLYNSNVDANTQFGAISKEGKYVYTILAAARSYYAKNGKEVSVVTSKSIGLYSIEFSVKKSVSGGSISVHTCDYTIYQGEGEKHPHYICYQCSICGKLKEDTSKTNYNKNCSLCNSGLQGVRITIQPKSVTTPKGTIANVSFTATGDGLSYAWYYKDKNASFFSKTTTFTSNTYTVEMNEVRDGRQIYCVVKDKYGKTVQTNTVTLTMGNPAKITRQLKSVTVANGAMAYVTFAAAGDGLTYTWYYKNKDESSFSKTATFTSNSYSAVMNTTRHGRQIYCVVTDKYGNSVQTDTVTLSMAGAVNLVQQPKSVTTPKGTIANVSVTAAGDGLSYAWYYKDKNASSFSKTNTFTSNTYIVEMNEVRDGRQIYCVVKDKYGNSVQTNTVTLTMGNPAKITQQPESALAAKGEMVNVSFTATGDGLTYTWYYKSKGMTGFAKTNSFTGNSYSVAMDATLDGRQIYCVVKDKYGNSEQTNTVTLTMGSPARITRQPESVTAAKGEMANVSFTATGDGLTYTWYFKNKGVSYFSKTNSFTSNSYSVAMDATRDGRQIYCVVKDKYGNCVETDVVTLIMS